MQNGVLVTAAAVALSARQNFQRLESRDQSALKEAPALRRGTAGVSRSRSHGTVLEGDSHDIGKYDAVAFGNHS